MNNFKPSLQLLADGWTTQGFREELMADEDFDSKRGGSPPRLAKFLPLFRSAEELLGRMGISNLGERIAENVLRKYRWTRRGHASDSS